jgi:hypothetical protein
MFKVATGQLYLRFLAQLHASTLFDWYLEIGCRDGKSFAPVRSKTIAVDPFFQADLNIIGPKPQLHIFQTTSDDFFKTDFLKRNKIKLSFAFLDGMHLIEYLLRDFVNAEAAAAPGAAIAIHDCVPSDADMTTRDLSGLKTTAWAGDVWKLLPILAEYRPDLKVEVLNCRPTGLVLVSNLSPRSTVLTRAYDEILARYQMLAITDYGVKRFGDSFDLMDPRAFRDAGYPSLARATIDESHALNPVMVTL